MKVSNILLALTTIASTVSAFLVPSTRNALTCSNIGMIKQNNKNINISNKKTNTNNIGNEEDDDDDEDAIYVADFMSKMTTEMDEESDDDYSNNDYDDDDEPTSKSTFNKPNQSSPSSSRWDKLTPMAKSRLQKEAVDKKLANNRSESKADKRRRT
jgi:hypothetical protein